MTFYLGNKALLNRRKVAFFASSKTVSLGVLPLLDRAAEMAKHEDVAVCSGFQSPLEKRILPYLLRGKCGIIVALNRSIYKIVPEQYRQAFEAGRILFVSLRGEGATRPSKAAGERRNRYLADLADKIVIAASSPDSSLHALSETYPDKCSMV